LGADGHLDTTNVSVIYEKVKVSLDGNSFTGTGLIKVLSGLNRFDPNATVLSTFPIDLKAKRVTQVPASYLTAEIPNLAHVGAAFWPSQAFVRRRLLSTQHYTQGRSPLLLS
jgi:hypothetical protein